MDKYEELIAVFSETLKQSRDYHIAYMYQVGYVSVLGLYESCLLYTSPSPRD